jgi:glyoxylase-like metal-dependent hydrolase (beta-lactamase superfamily II)
MELCLVNLKSFVGEDQFMEVRTNQHGPDSPATKVFFSGESGFEVASVIVTGKTDAVLIDAQWTLSNAHRVVAEILETGKYLKTVYVTHAHPDHYFGLGPVAEAFPEARVTALPSVARIINKQFFGKI